MKEWADKYKGKFDDGWDAYRERVFKRAKEKGWIPANAQLTPRHETMPSWDSIPEDEKPFQRRLMEVAAGYAEHVDAQAGRVIEEIERLGYGDNTLIFYIWGDNGSSAEGQNGTVSELLAQNGIPSTIKQHIHALEELGGLDALGSPKTDPVSCRLGLGRQHSLQGDQAPRLALRRHAESDGLALAGEAQARRRAARAIPPLQRCRANDLRDPRYHTAA
jgi:arylsulfatase A-like enzyme